MIRSYLRRCKLYGRVKPKEKYVPGKVRSHFIGTDESTHSIIPKTYPAALQSGIAPASRLIPYTNPVSLSIASTLRPSSIPRMPKRSHGYISLAGTDATVKPMKTSKPASVVDMRRSHSRSRSCSRGSFTDMRPEENISTRSSRSGSLLDDYPPKYTTDEHNEVYSHSDLLLDEDNYDVFDDPNAVISYDQEELPLTSPFGPGSLFFVVEYNQAVPELLVTIKSGIELPTMNGEQDSQLSSYVNFCLVPEDFLWQKTNVILNETNPVFDETFRIQDVLYHKLREYTLCFYVMDCTNPTSECVIGKVLYPLSDLREGVKVEVCKELSSP